MVETTQIKVGTHRFTVDTDGPQTGETVLFLHGYPNSRHSWTELLSGVAERGFRGVAPDQRGYSPGARPEAVADYHVDRLVQDVIGLADAIGAPRFHLVGHDWGGQIAWLTAARHPERLRSLTVLSRPHPAAFAAAMKSDPQQAKRSGHHKAFQDANMAERLLADDARRVRRTLCFENALQPSAANPKQPAAKRRMSDEAADQHLSVLGSPAAMNAALNWYRAAFSGNSTLARADVPPVVVPTVYMWGNEDMSVGQTAATLTADFVDAPYHLESIDGAGHFLSEEVPQRVLRALLGHLENNTA